MEMNAKQVHGDTLYRATWGDRYPLVFVLALLRFFFKVCTLRVTEACISTASSFYSACGYAVREKKGTKKHLLIATGGGGAAFFAIMVVLWKFFVTFPKANTVWYYFKPTELDVLGSIFTQAKFYNWAHHCFWAIQSKNMMSNDATIALSLKWYANHPSLRPEDVKRMKRRVEKLLDLHSEWDDTIRSRLYPFIGEAQRGVEARREIARLAREGRL